MAIAGGIIVLVCVGFSLFLLYSVSKKAALDKKKEEKIKKTEQNRPVRPFERPDPPFTKEDAKEAERLNLRSVELVRSKNWAKLDAMSDEHAGMSRELRTALLHQWGKWNAIDDEEQLVGLCGLLRGAVGKSGEDAKRVFERVREKISTLMWAERDRAVRRIAIRTYAAFPPKVVGEFLWNGLYLGETDDEIRALLVGILSDRADESIYRKALLRFQMVEDEVICAEAALIMHGIHKRTPVDKYEEHRTEILIPKLEGFEESDLVKRALDEISSRR